MKKLKFKLITIMLAITMVVTFLVGCDNKLVTTNTQRDMAQVIATVQTSADTPKENIYKRDLLMLYMQYGQTYVQSYGYTVNQTIELLVDSLVNNRIAVQSAQIYFDEKGMITDSTITDKFNMDRYLDEEELLDANYNALKSINSFIETYLEDDGNVCQNDHGKEEKEEEKTETIRPIKTGAVNADEEVTKEKKEEYVEKGIDTTCSHLKRAYNRAIKVLERNGFIKDDFDYSKDSIFETDYYQMTLKSLKESALLEKYEDTLSKEIFSTVTYEMLATRYEEMYQAQSNDYQDLSAYKTALSSATIDKPIVVNSANGYGYVYNLLLGADETQNAEIKALQSKRSEENLSNDAYKAERANVLNKTMVKDLRSTWITEGYDFDEATKTFTGDYSFVTEASERLAFQGDVVCTNAEDAEEEDYKAEYEVTKVKEFSLNQFIDFMDGYLYGASKTDAVVTGYYKTVNTTANEYFDDKVQDLLLAFSTDTGSLNTYKGYVSAPQVDIGGSETYVEEFAKAAREVLEMPKGSYIIVATDFGYHIVFNSESIVSGDYDNLDAYLDSLTTEKKIGETTYNTWKEYYAGMIENIKDFEEDESDFYLYKLQSAYTASVVSSKISQAFVEKYKAVRETKDAVKVYEDRYEDLFVEEEQTAQ